MIFDVIELITFVFALIAFIFVLKAYFQARAEILPQVMDTFGEYLIIIFSLNWVCIAFSFMSASDKR